MLEFALIFYIFADLALSVKKVSDDHFARSTNRSKILGTPLPPPPTAPQAPLYKHFGDFFGNSQVFLPSILSQIIYANTRNRSVKTHQYMRIPVPTHLRK